MTTTLTTLERKLEQLIAQSGYLAPRRLVLVLEAGRDIPATVRATLRPGDQVVIEEIPPGYFGYQMEDNKE